MSQQGKVRRERTLPAHIQAETTVLGAILIDSEYYRKVVGKLETADFSMDSHQRIFARMAELAEQGSAIDIVTLTECLERHREIDVIGGRAYLFGLTENLPMRPALKDYLRILREKRRLRELIAACTEAVRSAYDAAPSGEIKERLWDTLGVSDGSNYQSAPAANAGGAQDSLQ